MRKLNFILNVFLVLILSGCNSEDDFENIRAKGILIFGEFAGSTICSGDCSSIYKIDTENIYKDIGYNYPKNVFFEGDFELIDHINYQNFKSLIAELPNEIFIEPDGYLDCSDCTNENGGYYLEFQGNNGYHKTWRFRNAIYPDYIENYRSLLLEKLAVLNSL